jgi:pimeloyl-ACP methyl ester carboxylesterase
VPRRTSVGPATVPYLEGGVGRPLVFLHGWGVGPAAYRGGLARIAAAGFRVLAPCLPAFGGTPDLPTEECSFAGYARFVAAWLDALGVTEPVAVVGHSFGGGVAIQFAADRPERVAGLVLCNAAGGLVRATGGGREDGSATRPLWDWGRRLGADLLRPESLVRVVPAVLECAVPNLFANPRGLWRVAGFVRRADLMGELASVRARGVPVRVVWSDRDLLVSYRSFVAQREAAGGGIVVPGPHSWLIASPERFADVVVGELEAADLEQRADRRARGALDDRGGHCAGIGGEPGSRLPRARPVGR